MGILRIFLALSVVLYHAGALFGFAGVGGATAVQAFFIVSGFYMALILNEKYATPEENRVFYKTRLLRIFGLYWPILTLYLVAAAVLFATTHSGPLDAILKQGVGSLSFWVMALSNVLLVGLDGLLYFVFAGDGIAFSPNHAAQDPGLFRGIVVQPAWSLSPELMFYALAPFIVRRSLGAVLGIVIGSMVLRLGGLALGLVGDPWSYRFFPFELMHFLLGAVAWHLHRRRAAPEPNGRDVMLVTALALAFLIYQHLGDMSVGGPYFDPMRVTFLGLLTIALPSLFALTRHSKLDRTIGELSFALYLVHMLVLSAVLRLPHMQPGEHGFIGENGFSAAVVVGTLIAAVVIERLVGYPVERVRTLLKRRAGITDSAPALV